MAYLYGNNLSNTINGTSWKDYIHGYGGNDYLYGNGGDDGLIGGAGNDYIHGGSGMDIVGYIDATSGVTVSLVVAGWQYTGASTGYDWLTMVENLEGSNYADRLTGDSGANKLYGLQGDDYLDAGEGNDKIYGGQGNDTIYGRGGDDLINAAMGNDQLFGGAGRDVFEYRGNNGYDRIFDFQNGADRIDFSDHHIFTNYWAVLARATDTFGGLLIYYDGDDAIFLKGVSRSQLDASDFIF